MDTIDVTAITASVSSCLLGLFNEISSLFSALCICLGVSMSVHGKVTPISFNPISHRKFVIRQVMGAADSAPKFQTFLKAPENIRIYYFQA